MPPEITGPGGAAGGVPILPSAPVRPATPSRAVVPVERVGPRAPADSPLGRSGVALDDLLFAPDQLETREALTPVAMELGLETARRQLLQRMPAESLVSLDAVWGRAEGSEEGWYLRAGALTVLGHPQEGDKVAGEGLQSQPQSLALRLVQSVARALVGDLSGARAALYPALDSAPNDPVLLAQQAVVLARQGHADDAAALLRRIADAAPDHPAIAWARAMARTAATDRTRTESRIASFVNGSAPRDGLPDVMADPIAGGVSATDDADLVASAFRGLGAALRTQNNDALTNSARMLLRACSAGGTLASACTPPEAHAARQVLSALLTALRPESPGAVVPGRDAPPLSPLLTQLLPLLRSERAGESPLNTADAERVLRRFGATVPPEIRRLLTFLVEGADGGARRVDSDDVLGALFSGETELGPLVPVRLGLSLLAETSATRALERRQEVVGADAASAALVGAVFVPTTTPQSSEAITGELSGIGWGGAAAASGGGGGGDSGSAAGTGAAFPVILLLAAAIGAAMNGAAIVAAVLGAAGVWLALRSRGQSR